MHFIIQLLQGVIHSPDDRSHHHHKSLHHNPSDACHEMTGCFPPLSSPLPPSHPASQECDKQSSSVVSS